MNLTSQIRAQVRIEADGEIKAKAWPDGQTVVLSWSNGRVKEKRATADSNQDLPWLANPLFDPQINGFGGIDFQQDNLNESDLLVAVQGLREAGCGRFLFTLITDEWDLMLRRLQHVRRLRLQCPTLREAIAGWHVEGPFLSAQPGFRGAHPAGLMRDPCVADIHRLRDTLSEDVILLTLAPERTGSMAAIRAAVDCGMRVSIGHTDASLEQIQQAVAAGAEGFTHLGNGCPQTLDRHDNILWRVMDTKGLTVSLIPDTHHVTPVLFRALHRLFPEDRLFYTTDAISAAGSPPGTYPLGPLRIEVADDGIVRFPDQDNFAGSGLRPIDGVLRAAGMLRCSWRETWAGFSTRSAAWLDLATPLRTGEPARFCLINEGDDGNIARLEIICPI